MSGTGAMTLATPMPRMAAAAALYGAALLQGLTLVSFPASSAWLRVAHGFSDAQYGAIFLPQVAAAVIGALGGAALSRRLSLATLLALALLANAVSQFALGATQCLTPNAAYLCVLFGTSFLGLGFGLAGAPLNGYPARLFPNRPGVALVAAHSALGAGLMIGPLAAGELIMRAAWLAFPLSLAVVAILMAAYSLKALPVERDTPVASTGSATVRSGGLALFVSIAVLYAFAEGTFSNWTVVYLSETKTLTQDVATAALSVFWGALVVGRLAVSALLLRVSEATVWRLLPPLMIVAFLLLPYANDALSAIVFFALAGLACSAYFPLCIAIASQRFPERSAQVASLLTAALMIGVGLGSFAIGQLREMFAIESIYRLSAIYPAAALALAWFALKPSRSRA